MENTTSTKSEALAVAAELRKLTQSGRVIVHPGKILDLAKRLEATR